MVSNLKMGNFFAEPREPMRDFTSEFHKSMCLTNRTRGYDEAYLRNAGVEEVIPRRTPLSGKRAIIRWKLIRIISCIDIYNKYGFGDIDNAKTDKIDQHQRMVRNGRAGLVEDRRL